MFTTKTRLQRHQETDWRRIDCTPEIFHPLTMIYLCTRSTLGMIVQKIGSMVLELVSMVQGLVMFSNGDDSEAGPETHANLCKIVKM